jgi:pantoate--beta-alanine ligase
MILFKKSGDLHKWLDAQRAKEISIGFVPTMGALHTGHISLVENSKKGSVITVSSIFVNPVQFNDPKDFQKYPITLEKDIYMLEAAGFDVLFLPSVHEIYPEGTSTKQPYDLGYLETILEGKYRPGHFQGVCMVVNRLLKIVKPDHLYLGQKDYQQCMVISKLIDLIGMQDMINVKVCATLREPGGLAMSSRNIRLSEKERETATTIYQCLGFIKLNLKKGNTAGLLNKASEMLLQKGFRIDYVAIADATDLSLVNEWDGKQAVVVLIAAFINEVRLIDNMLLTD